MRIYKRGIFRHCTVLITVLICILCCAYPVAAAPSDDYAAGGTDGTEMQLMQPVQLEIRLGQEWAGSEFTLVTDVGQYPGTVTVAQDGTLRMELGGSQSYVLRLASTGSEVPVETAAPDADANPVNGEDTGEAGSVTGAEEPGGTGGDGGIPIFPIVLFGAGIVIAAGVLIVMRVVSKRQAAEEDDDDEDDESEYDDDEDDG